ncbi:MAG: hypothetical protein EOO41_02515 [Methanobacteriota archaeon]|nr:MAG: hypothetical protein EOO41_02515 [Euryarchaeota archaeon]
MSCTGKGATTDTGARDALGGGTLPTATSASLDSASTDDAPGVRRSGAIAAGSEDGTGLSAAADTAAAGAAAACLAPRLPVDGAAT